MDSKYSQYNYMQYNYEHEIEECLNFYNMINDVRTLDYDGMVDYIKNKFNTLEEKTIYFGKNCKLIIYLDKDKKYKFDFECENANLEKFREVFPELAELMKNKSVNQIRKLYPGLRSYSYQEEEPEASENFNNYDYIKSYNNITFNKK